MAEDGGHLVTLIRSYLCKCLISKYLEARGVEPLFPACYVQQRPRMLYQSHFRGEYVLMNKRGRTRMLLVLLLRWQAFGNIRNRSIGPLVSVIRTEGSAGSQRKRQTIRRRSRSLKSSNSFGVRCSRLAFCFFVQSGPTPNQKTLNHSVVGSIPTRCRP